MALTDTLEAVHDRETFLAFVAVLLGELERGGGRDMNTHTATFLEAALSATTDHEGVTDFLEQASWRGFAVFLYLGLIYE